ncbi:hypothetical protein HGRIS_004032 [Hohenbuehelia grisea]|uniref:F-box domain-containing protein n=1 Tax=Hohenbuehelia grisea TaxID=104357 RepID=A0ABR3JHR4_9AGAR
MAPLQFTKKSLRDTLPQCAPEFSNRGSPLTPQETENFRAELRAAVRDLAIVDRELSLHEAYGKKLRAQRDALSQFTNKYSVFSHPLERMPEEILSMIFSLCQPGHKHTSYILDTSQFPWPFTMVCSRWRAIAISTPSLWTQIGFNSPTPFLPELVLERSKDQPLDVTIDTKCLHHRPSLQLLVANCQRWKTLAFFGVSAKDVQRVAPHLQPLRNNLKLLRRIAFLYSFGFESHNLFDIFWKAPLLLDIELNGSSCLGIQLPWRQVEQIHIGDCGDDDDASWISSPMLRAWSIANFTYPAVSPFPTRTR